MTDAIETNDEVETLDDGSLKALKDLLGDDDQETEAAEKILDADDDFTVGDYRFIRSDAIGGILKDELEGDEYVLGCFNASVIADVTGWPLAMIEAAQKAEAFAAIGKGIIDGGHTEELASTYAGLDGYGHHFATYDGHEHEIGSDYYAFKVN